MEQLHIRLAKLYGWRVQHNAARYQLKNPYGAPVGGIFRSPLQAWKSAPKFLEDVSGMLAYARKQFGKASMTYDPTNQMYRFEIGGSIMVAPPDERSRVLATFILGLKQRQDDGDTGKSGGKPKKSSK